MGLTNLNFESITETDLDNLISLGVPEGVLTDYKKTMYGRTDADIKEFLKDISSFANTSGGHLIIGMDEAAGLPTSIAPLSDDADQDLQRLENLARDGLEPRVSGLRMRSVPIKAGGYVILIRVPKSWTPPHRVSARNTNRIYGRNSAGAYEFSIDELRVIFTSSATVLDRVRAFRSERLAKIDSGDAIVPLAQNLGRLVVHLVPISSFGLGAQVEPGKAQKLQELLSPLNSMGYSPRVNFDGFANIYSGSDSKYWSYTQVFRNGAIEAVKVRVVSDYRPGQLFIPTLDFDRWILGKLPQYLSALQQLDVPAPIIAMITLQGVRGARLGVATETFDEPPRIDRDVLELPECVIEQYGTELEYQKAVRPAFDALWNTGGFSRSQHFDSSGKWTPPH